MSRVSILGNASGTGTFTIASPNGNTDRTLTLPDQTATLITDSSGVLNIGSGQVYKDASGNLGIGTSSPNSVLNVVGAQTTFDTNVFGQMLVRSTAAYNATPRAGIVFSIKYNSAGAFISGGSSIQGYKQTASDGDFGNGLLFTTQADGAAPAERARIDSSGNLLVGGTATNPVTSRVNGAVISANGSIQSRSPSAFSYYGLSVTSGTHISFYTDNGTNFVTAGNIASNGANTSYNGTSDYRLKNNIQPLTSALNRVSQLRPVTWTWKEGYGGTRPECEGFIAHELQEILPIAVTGEKDAVDADGNPQYQGIDTSFLVATLTAAIQELKAIVDAQGAEIAALKGAA